jgi:hypothetical protein
MAAKTKKVPLDQVLYGSRPAEYPFSSAAASERATFPKQCQQFHWDPTQVIKRILPDQDTSLPLDPRPWTKVCLTYTTTSPFQAAPPVSDSMVFPSGGTFYPPARYSQAIDKESLLRRLDRPLGTCEGDDWVPSEGSTLFRAASTVPKRATPMTQFVQELAMPRVLLRDGPYQCRAEQDILNLQRSQSLFNNATKYDKYGPDARKPPPLLPQAQQSLS